MFENEDKNHSLHSLLVMGQVLALKPISPVFIILKNRKFEQKNPQNTNNKTTTTVALIFLTFLDHIKELLSYI